MHNDNPTNPESTSIKVLVRWMAEEGNYNHLKGGEGQHGETKRALALEIRNKIRDAGCLVHREPKFILTKINELVRGSTRKLFVSKIQLDKETTLKPYLKFAPTLRVWIQFWQIDLQLSHS